MDQVGGFRLIDKVVKQYNYMDQSGIYESVKVVEGDL